MSASAQRVVERFRRAFVKAPPMGQVKASLVNLKKAAEGAMKAVAALQRVLTSESDNFFDQFEVFAPYVAQNAEAAMERFRDLGKGVISLDDIEDIEADIKHLKAIKHPGKEVDPNDNTGIIYDMADAVKEGLDEFKAEDIQPYTWWARSLEQTVMLAETYAKSLADKKKVQALHRAVDTVKKLYSSASLTSAFNTIIDTVDVVLKGLK